MKVIADSALPLALLLLIACRDLEAFICTYSSFAPLPAAGLSASNYHTARILQARKSVPLDYRPVRRLKQGLSSSQDDEDKESEPELSSSSTSPAWLWKVCLPLWLVYVSNQWSRSSLYYLVDFSDSATATTAMNVDVGFSQVQYGVLASVAFTSLFAVASLGAGIAADRWNRKLLTVASALCWSLATVGTAVSDSYETLVACRIAMGLACAFSTPTAYTLIRERAPANRISLASSLYGTGVALASACASLTILLDSAVGWRNALDIVATFGVASAIATVVLLDDDPKEQPEEERDNDKAQLLLLDESSEKDNDTAFSEVLADVTQVVSTDRVKWIFIGSFLRFCSGLCIGVWSAPLYRQLFTDHQSDYAVAQAVISAGLATLSGLLGGATADWLSSNAAAAQELVQEEEGNSLAAAATRDTTGPRLWVPVVGSVLAAPAWYFAVQTDIPFESAMAWLAAEYFVAECWFGPTISTLQSTVGPRVGGTAQGLFTLTGAVANLAPSAVGYLYGAAGQQQGGGGTAAELSQILAASVCFGYLSSAVCFTLAIQSNDEEEREASTLV